MRDAIAAGSERAYLHIFLLAASVAGCAAPVTTRRDIDKDLVAREAENQRDVQLETFFKRSSHLQTVAWPLLTSNVDLCGKRVVNRYGIFFGTQSDFPEDYQPSARRVLGFDNELRVFHVMDTSPARTAGFEQGDKLFSLNGQALPSGKGATRKTIELMRSAPSPITFTVQSGNGQRRTVSIPGVPSCDYPVNLTAEDLINAAADGQQVIITQGMYRFADTDTELATVISHELAHNIMGHISKKTVNATGGLVFDILAAALGVNTQGAFSKAGANMYSQDFESEADYVGLYLMARAGLSVREAPNFWRRMAADNQGSLVGSHSATHPATPERFLALGETVREIDQKRRQNLALVPTLKDGARITNNDASGAIRTLSAEQGQRAKATRKARAVHAASMQGSARHETTARDAAIRAGCSADIRYLRNDDENRELYETDCITSRGAVLCDHAGSCTASFD